MSNRSISRQQCWPAHSGGLLAVYLVILTSTVLVTTAKASPPADLVLRGGKLVTMDAACPIAEAVAVRGGHIVLAGTSDDVAATIGPSTRVIELDGKLAIPGFVEGHGHFLGLGESKMILDLADAATWDEIVQQVAQAARTAPAGTWIVGRGWHQSKWEKLPDPCVEGNPTHAMLSARTPLHPVILTHASGHMCIVNAQAMQLAGLDSHTPVPAGGEILRDADGEPTGVLRENAMGLVRRVRARYQQQLSPAEQREEILTAIRLASEECLQHGVTSFQDAGSSLVTVDVFRSLAEQGRLPVRLWVMLNAGNDALAKRLAHYRMIGVGHDHLTVRTIKRLVDGARLARGLAVGAL